MEYKRDGNNQIQADLAGRIGKIAEQYEQLTPCLEEKDRFDATLHICLLQTLLTSCTELIKSKTDKEFEKEITPLLKEIKYEIIKNSFVSRVTNKALLFHIRDALSHPVVTQVSTESLYQITGYTTEKDENSDQIVAFIFTDSPDIKKADSIKTYPSEEVADYFFCHSKGFAKGVKPHPVGEKNFQLYRFEADNPLEPYVRIFQVKIDVENIKLLVTKLSEFLSKQK